MSIMYSRNLGILAAAIAALAVSTPAFAQAACLTSNCALGGTPTPCLNRAAPRTPTVLMGSAGLVFTPPDPKIEPGECIIWKSASLTHTSSGSACTANSLCNVAPSLGCEWDTANVSSAAATPSSTCFYDPLLFPVTDPVDNPPYPCRCRFHALMTGRLQVTTPIHLSVDKSAGSVKLSWSGGGVADDLSYKVARQSGGDPEFPVGSTTTVDPDGGVLDTTFTDAGDLGNPTTRYYLVRNKQTNEL